MNDDSLRFQLTESPSITLNEQIRQGVIQTHTFLTGHSLKIKPGAIYVYQASDFVGGVYFECQETGLWINNIWVSPLVQGQGVGSKLMVQVEEYAKAQNCSHLQLTTLFDKACQFYQRRGFRIIAKVPKWQFGLDCYFMQKEI